MISTAPILTRLKAAETSITEICNIINRDGGVIVENFISRDHAQKIQSELKPYFDADTGDKSGFFPSTTQRATGLIAKSPSCVDLMTNPMLIGVANALLSDTYTYWLGTTRHTVTTKPILSSTVGFRVNPGSAQQGLHRDDLYVSCSRFLVSVYVILEMLMMMGIVTGISMWSDLQCF